MKINVTKKLAIIILLIFALINCIPTLSKASFIDNVFKEGKDFINSGTQITNELSTDSNSVYVPLDQQKITDLSSNVYNALLTVAIIIAAIILSVLGIQFITGSLAQKAKVKEMLIPFLVGCVVIFGAFGIWKIAVSIASKI